MVKNSLSLTLVMVSYVHLLTTLSMMVYLEFLILLPIYYLSINFVCKTMHFATLILLDSLFKIYQRGRSFTRMVSTLFLHHLLCTYPIPLPFLPHKFISLHKLLLVLLKFLSGITDLDIRLPNSFILLFSLLILILHSIKLMYVVLLVHLV